MPWSKKILAFSLTLLLASLAWAQPHTPLGPTSSSGTLLPSAAEGQIWKADPSGDPIAADVVESEGDLAITTGSQSTFQTDLDGNWRVSGASRHKDYTTDPSLVSYFPLTTNCEDAKNATSSETPVNTPAWGTPTSYGITGPLGAPVSRAVMYMADWDDGCYIPDGGDGALDALWTGEFTILVWVKKVVNAQGANQWVFQGANPSSGLTGPSFRMTGSAAYDSGVRWAVETAGVNETYAAIMTTDWHMYSLRYGGAAKNSANYTLAEQLEIFLDGAAACFGSCTNSDTVTTPNNSNTAFGISHTGGAATTGISGYMSSLMIFSRILADWELCEISAWGPDGTWTNGEAACLATAPKPMTPEIGIEAPATCRTGEVFIDTTSGGTNCAPSTAPAFCVCAPDNTWTADR